MSVSRRGRLTGPLDGALHQLGLSRRVSLVVGSYLAAFRIVASSDLLGAGAYFGDVPGIRTFSLPVPTPARGARADLAPANGPRPGSPLASGPA